MLGPVNSTTTSGMLYAKRTELPVQGTRVFQADGDSSQMDDSDPT